MISIKSEVDARRRAQEGHHSRLFGNRVSARFEELGFVEIEPAEKGNPGRAHCEDPRNGDHERRAEHYAIIALAGPAAQRKFAPDCDTASFLGDYLQAASVQLATVGEDDDGFYKAMDREAGELVEEHWASIERVAQALLEHGTLQPDEIDALLSRTT